MMQYPVYLVIVSFPIVRFFEVNDTSPSFLFKLDMHPNIGADIKEQARAWLKLIVAFNIEQKRKETR